MSEQEGAPALERPARATARPQFREVRRGRGVRSFLYGQAQWVSLGAALVAWEVVGRAAVFSFLPPFSDVAAAWVDIASRGKFNAFAVSLQALALGFTISLVLGVVFAVATTASETLDYVLSPYVNMLMSTPTAVLIPVLTLLFGLGLTTRIVVIFLYAFFMILVNTQAGLRAVNPAHVEMARSFGASRWEILRKVTLPAAMPLFLTGIRLGLSRGLRGMINAEVVISVTGIGALLILYGRTFNMPALYAVVISVIVLAVVATSAIGFLERRMLRWQR